ncbi:uncharacterized protein LOC112601293 [Melanaphis sacchari]|uniref:uncharacterized protein LOC112601293 n=1 Tax=Melanaphis sacchari TaxID=742174 RepID=UPI000DC1319D|nr:uncharacterized protein LOC112601293 [Melanaphis sacchari]
MSSQFSIFSVVLIFLGGQCFYGVNGNYAPQEEEVTDISGRWYAVMSTGCTDGQDCSIFSNNQKPCSCILANFINLQNSSWLVYMSAVNIETSKLTVDLGGASCASPNNVKEIQGFIYSRASTSLSVISQSECSITEKVNGCKFFLRYKMTIIASSLQYGYMITSMPIIEGSNSGQTLTVIWCRNKTPGKATIWTQIVQHMKRINMDIHKLAFINQLDCKYPSQNQCNEMFFCA